MRGKAAVVFALSLIFAAVCFCMPAFAEWEEQWMYRNEDGSWKADEWIREENGSLYYIDPQGVMARGWYEASDGSVRFFDELGAMVRGLNLIDGRYYYFGDDGILTETRLTVDGQEREIPREGAADWGGPLPEGANEYSETELVQDRAVNYGKSPERYFWNWFSAVLMAAAGGVVCFACRRRRDFPEIIMMTVAVMFASTPLFIEYMANYDHDLIFHLNRLLGVSESLKTGMFPVRLNGYAFEGYGYADPVFYPQLFLYFPALLCMLGMPLVPAVHCFILFINAVSAAVMYYSGRLLFRSDKIACCSAVLYVLSVYRLSNLYTRAAFGESLAMMFFPLVVCGLYELFYGDEKRWYLLVVAFTGIFQSHMLSTVLIAAVCVAVGVCSLKRLLEKKRLIALGKVLIFSLLINVWFLVPLLDYMGTDITTGNLRRVFWDRLAPWSVLLKLFPESGGWSPLLGWDMSNIMALSPGLGIFAGMLVFVLLWIRGRKKPEKMVRIFFCIGVCLMIATSTVFPWRILMEVPLIQKTVSYMQFPWRLIGEAVCVLSLAGGYAFCSLGEQLQSEGNRAGMRISLYMTVLVLSLVSSQYYLDGLSGWQVQVWGKEQVPSAIQDSVQEYRYPDTDTDFLTLGTAQPSDERVTVTASGNTVLSAYCTYKVSGTSMDQVYLDMPVLYYPGYHAVDEDGTELRVGRGYANVVRVYPLDGSGTIRVFFKEGRKWRLSELVSLLGLVGFAAVLLREKRRS
ncbi:MAG: hypothetical protein Q4C73_05215 [Eubacteriales bacterium]|nr:hypothetical protein [Eubacteriales bacterium]